MNLNQLQLLKERYNELFYIEDEELYWREDAARGNVKAGKKAGTVRPDGYIIIMVNGKLTFARTIIKIMRGEYNK